MIEVGTRVVAQGRYIGEVGDAVAVEKDGETSTAYRIDYMHGVIKLHGWFLARDVVASSLR